MTLVERAYLELFPDRPEGRLMVVKYSHAFRGYNANVKYNPHKIEFRLSFEWKDVSEEIVIGLLQVLFLKMLREKRRTMQIDLYHAFIRKLATYTPADKSDVVLEASFDRVNDTYFNSLMDRPNLVWGGESARKLGSFDYTTNTIVISTLFREESELLDYIMYHELLHKKLKFYEKNGRSFHHTPFFKEQEKKFLNPRIEQDLEKFLRKHRLKRVFRFW